MLHCDSQLMHRCCKFFVLRLLKFRNEQKKRYCSLPNSTENIEASFVVLLRTPGPSGEQVGPGLAEPHKGPAVMEFKPAAFDGEREARHFR